MTLEILRPENEAEWMQVLARCVCHDFYHLPAYHAFCEPREQGAAHFFVYSRGQYLIALPLLLRSLDGVQGIDGAGWKDATSVYGSAGPLVSHESMPEDIIRDFQQTLKDTLQRMGLIAVFSRLHPLLPQLPFLDGLGEFPSARTVSIDLTLPVAVQRARFRKNHKEGINRLRRQGVTCVRDEQRTHLEEFVNLYHETMRRVDALDYYFFPVSYFIDLCEVLGPRLNLFVCLQEGRVISGGLFVACGGILQYHLGGTLNEALKIAPMKLLIDEVRLWGTAEELRVFHLGGGATPHPDDSLLLFKMGFSDRLHDCPSWRWVLNPEVYHRLSEEKVRWNERHGLQTQHPSYFPRYRCPTRPALVSPAASVVTEP
jgi:hypothetical protein